VKPIGQIINLWRVERGLTQAAVAQRSGGSRPNLSAIEQGARDLTVQTLRRIAAVLGVSPGTLVDGMGPKRASLKEDRYSLDRIARLAVGESLSAPLIERQIARELASFIQSKSMRSGGSQNIRSKNISILKLKLQLGPKVFRHLLQRVSKILEQTHE